MASTQELFNQLKKYYPPKVCVVVGDALNFRQDVLNRGGKGCEYAVLTNDPDLSKSQLKGAFSEVISNDQVLSFTVGSMVKQGEAMALRASEIANRRAYGHDSSTCIDPKLRKYSGKLHRVPLKLLLDNADCGSNKPDFGRMTFTDIPEYNDLQGFVHAYYYGEKGSLVSMYALMPGLRVEQIKVVENFRYPSNYLSL